MANKKIVPAVIVEKNPAAVSLGKRGGDETAKRGSEYFRKIAAKRKNFRGGRPPSNSN
jgi:hypothetical protein